MEEAGVPGGAETDGLRENGGETGTRDAVEAFVPPVVGGDLQTRDGESYVLHLGNFFFEGHARDEIIDALIERSGRIEVYGSCGGRSGGVDGRGLGMEQVWEEQEGKDYGEFLWAHSGRGIVAKVDCRSKEEEAKEKSSVVVEVRQIDRRGIPSAKGADRGGGPDFADSARSDGFLL